MTYKHAGDIGDLLAFLPVIRHHGSGVLHIEAATYTRRPLLKENWNGIDRICKAQPYISDVREWRGERIDVNGNDFRS